jgi:leucyl-tRNA synthetase/predicted alpha/beta hydrolase family esterase
MERYNPKKIEPKWQKFWAKNSKLFAADEKSGKPKQYILDMFPYPSGDGLHAGHVESYTATDIISRYWRMKGKNVLHPQGWDAFGLPAENYAIKTKIHPSITTQKAIATFKAQMKMMGFSYDWSRELNSADPDYYKWTQWFFLLLYKNGLAYKAKGKVNWCDSCQTVLANEQAEGGVCERCGKSVVQKDLEQWFFKITEFIEDRDQTSGLINGLDKIDWPDSTKAAQKNWIGKSEGAQFEMNIEGTDKKIQVFTTRLDTVFGMTFALIAPEHPIIKNLESRIKNYEEVKKYIEAAKKKSELQRMAEVKEKTGIELKGIKVLNPFTQQAIPLFASDFILAHYGTGAVMAVPGHDQRDFEFAKKFGLPIVEVIVPQNQKSKIKNQNDNSKLKILEQAFVKDGILVNSNNYNGLTSAEAQKKMTALLEKEGIGKKVINYKLRDWLVSRQRYWGAPIPIIYCDDCKTKKYNYVILHGYVGTSRDAFLPALKAELEKQGHSVFAPDLPNPGEPGVEEQANFVMKNAKIGANTIIVGWSLGGVVAMRILEKTKKKIARLFLVDSFIRPEFQDQSRENVVKSHNWKFNYKKIKRNAERIDLIVDNGYPIIGKDQAEKMSELFDATLYAVKSKENHFEGSGESELIKIVSENGIFSVSEKDLPVKLPDDVDFMPTGESPLAKSKKFQNVKCPKCGGEARRESDTMDTFVCSSWYYFRYADPKNKKEPFDKIRVKYWLPVDLYVGGAEHTVLHLLYSRFFTKVLHNLGYIDFDEPFAKMRHQGIILAEDGRKMSKSLGNVITPDSVVEQYGADALRMFEMFMGPLEDMKPWNTKGIIGISRFLERIWKLKSQISNPNFQTNPKSQIPKSKNKRDVILSEAKNLNPLLHRTIKKVSEDIEALKFNTAISALMILVNESGGGENVNQEQHETFLKLLAPFAPHMAEELWSQLGYKKSIFTEKWPEYDKNLIKEETIELVVQINGKVRARLFVPADISEEEAKKMATCDVAIKKWLAGKEPKKIIFVKGRLVNIVA